MSEHLKLKDNRYNTRVKPICQGGARHKYLIPPPLDPPMGGGGGGGRRGIQNGCMGESVDGIQFIMELTFIGVWEGNLNLALAFGVGKSPPPPPFLGLG